MVAAVAGLGCGDPSVPAPAQAPGDGGPSGPSCIPADAGQAAADTSGGSYTECAYGYASAPGATAPLERVLGGGVAGAGLRVTQDGPTLTATATDGFGHTLTVPFAASASGSTALLSPAGATATMGYLGCGAGGQLLAPGVTPTVATFTASKATLLYAAGVTLMSVEGTFAANLGPAGDASTPGVFWVGCSAGPNPFALAPADASRVDPAMIDASAPDAADGNAGPSLPVGSYACGSTFVGYPAEGTGSMLGGLGGTLTLAQAGAVATVGYADIGKPGFSGSLSLDVVSDSVAVATPGRSASAVCVELPQNGAALSVETYPRPSLQDLGAASLIVDGPSLFLTFQTAGDAGCGLDAVSGFIACSKQ